MITKDEKLNKILPEIEKSIREAFGEKVNKIILFGSYARGDYNEESDVDILVVVDDDNTKPYKLKRNELTKFYLENYGILLSIIIQPKNHIERYKEYSPFLINVVKEGQVIYGWEHCKPRQISFRESKRSS